MQALKMQWWPESAQGTCLFSEGGRKAEVLNTPLLLSLFLKEEQDSPSSFLSPGNPELNQPRLPDISTSLPQGKNYPLSKATLPL